MTTLHAAAAAQGLRLETESLCKSVPHEAPALAQYLQSGKPEAWVGPVLAELLRGVPVPATCHGFKGGLIHKPAAHARCFYFSPTEQSHELKGRLDSAVTGVVAFKGMEPLCADHDELLKKLQQTPVPENMPTTQRRMTEHFALRESKVPGTLTWTEVVDESQAALDLQKRHIEAYGTHARAPFPLATVRFGQSVTTRILELCKRRLSRESYARAENLAVDGFGAYVYYYPSPAIRVTELDAMLPGGKTFHDRLATLERNLDPESVIERWVTLMVRLMYLGFLPASLASYGTGNMVGGQNAVVDGGFVDCDSLVRISDLIDETAFHDAIHFTMNTSFLRTVHSLLVKNRLVPDDVVGKYVQDYLFARFRAAFASEARPGLTLDPRIVAYFSPPETFASLVERLRAYHYTGEELALNMPFPQARAARPAEPGKK